MSTKWAAQRPEIAPINVRLTADERDRLRELLFEEGMTSMSSWFRQQAIRKIKEATTPAAGITHG
jgi:hypothetical protein